MRQYVAFDVGDDEVGIVLHPDGSLTIEMDSQYGEADWEATTKTVRLDPEKVAQFVRFLTPSD